MSDIDPETGLCWEKLRHGDITPEDVEKAKKMMEAGALRHARFELSMSDGRLIQA